ncbi:MAG: VanZ family protein [Porticoccaceae bacterium]|nr:VanZ family protein [Porticoccaceae bacterium]
MILITAYRATFWCLLVVVGLFSVVTLEPIQHIFDWQDKLHHLLAYAVLFWLLLGAYEQQQKLWKLAILLAAFSGLIEIAQSYTGYRQADWMDLLANIIGILVAAFLHMLRRNF